jgi:hypothetical protein
MPQLRAMRCRGPATHATRPTLTPLSRRSPMDAAARPSTGRFHAQSPLSHRDARLIIIGMMLPVFMGSLDSTILATACPQSAATWAMPTTCLG